jgi:hypothetical protein
MRKILIVIAFIVELFSVSRWYGCWLFKDIFYFTPSMISARTIDSINLNRGMPVLLTHLMHNKIIYLFWGGLQIQLQYWDVRFLKDFIGIIGFIGIVFAFWYLVTTLRKNFFVWFLFLFCVAISFIEMFLQPNIIYVWKLVVFGSSFGLLSLIGLWQFLKPESSKRYWFILFLLIISILTLIYFPLSYQAFCLKI